MPEQTADLSTENLPTMEPETRSKVKKGATAVFIVAGSLLLIDDVVKRFKRRKTVEVSVTDKPED